MRYRDDNYYERVGNAEVNIYLSVSPHDFRYKRDRIHTNTSAHSIIRDQRIELLRGV